MQKHEQQDMENMEIEEHDSAEVGVALKGHPTKNVIFQMKLNTCR